MVAKTDMVQYVGGATRRKISVAQFKAVEITTGKDLNWGRENKKLIPVGDMSTEALEYLLDEHPREFRVVKAAEAKEELQRDQPAVTGQGAPPAQG